MRTLLSVSLLLAAAPSFAQLASETRMGTGTTAYTTSTSNPGPFTAPAGSQWSQLQTAANAGDKPNGTLGNTITYNSPSSFGPFRQGDDFTVPAGQTWNVSSLTLYGFFTGATPTSQFSSGVLQIWNARPGTPGASVVAGDLTTNRVASTSFANLYRIGRGSATTTSPILAASMNLSATLTAGTYWFEYGLAAGTSNVYAPLVTIPGQTTVPDANSFWYTSQTYYSDLDSNSMVPLALPYQVYGQAVPEPAALAPLGLAALALVRRRRK